MGPAAEPGRRVPRRPDQFAVRPRPVPGPIAGRRFQGRLRHQERRRTARGQSHQTLGPVHRRSDQQVVAGSRILG